MNRAAAAAAAVVAFFGAFWHRRASGAAPSRLEVAAQDLFSSVTAPAPAPAPTVLNVALPPASVPDLSAVNAQRNRAGTLAAISAAEGTPGQGGYGALFGWPRAGRSFDPYGVTDHPRIFFDYTDNAGRKLKTSAAGKYQITYTTWRDERQRFLAWAASQGLSTVGFLPATQDAFALYLLHRDGALGHVDAGRFDAAMNIARGRWASLPGAGVNQPERTRAFVLNAYTAAGGTVAA